MKTSVYGGLLALLATLFLFVVVEQNRVNLAVVQALQSQADAADRETRAEIRYHRAVELLQQQEAIVEALQGALEGKLSGENGRQFKL